MDQKIVFMTIIGMSIVTYLPRLFPLLILAGRELPDWVITWLRYVSPAVLAAMLFPAIFLVDDQVSFGLDNLFLWAAIPAFLAAILTRKLFLPVIIGMTTVILGRLLL